MEACPDARHRSTHSHGDGAEAFAVLDDRSNGLVDSTEGSTEGTEHARLIER